MRTIIAAALAVALVSTPALAVDLPLAHYVKHGFNSDLETLSALADCEHLAEFARIKAYEASPTVTQTPDEVEAVVDHYLAAHETASKAALNGSVFHIAGTMDKGELRLRYESRFDADWPVCLDQMEKGEW